jgi:hypothetical protein
LLGSHALIRIQTSSAKSRSPKNKNGHKAHSNVYCIHRTGLYDGGEARKQQIQKSPKKGLLDRIRFIKKQIHNLLISGKNREIPFLHRTLLQLQQNNRTTEQSTKILVAGAGFEPTTFGL